MHIPFVRLDLQYQSIKAEIDRAIQSSLSDFTFIGGKEVERFASEFKSLIGSAYCIPTGNGTDSLFVALKALGIGENDEVITPAFSWISSSETITLCGAKPVFADIHPVTYTIDPSSIEQLITERTKAIVVVHLYGQAADVKEITAICRKYNLLMLEDCAQAHFTKDQNQYVGTFGDAGAFSFYPTKNLGAYGDAGCIVTHDAALAEKMKRLANHGALKKDDHEIEGTNSRMDTLQASILLAKLPHLSQWNEQRIRNAEIYNNLLKDVHEVTLPVVRPDTTHTFHIYAIRAQKRNELQLFLLTCGIQTIVHYPRALPHLPAYAHLQHGPDSFPVATQLQEETLSLPIYPDLKIVEIEYICEKIKEFYRK